ncbi:MAG: GntR family transcriptional regulator [Parvibaculaceae bacterium]
MAATGASARRAKVKKPTRSDDMAHRLESEILGGTLPPGTRLDEHSLARRFGVSRTPVREALRQLVSSGLVHIRPHHGAVVRQLTLPELIEMFQVVAELEGLGARLAARRISKEEREQLRASHEKCKQHVKKREEELFLNENNRLHDIILLASGNRFLIGETRKLVRRVNPYRRFVTQRPGTMEKSVREHAAVISAVETGNGAEAQDLMRRHLNMLGEEAGDLVISMASAQEAPVIEARKSGQRSQRARSQPSFE